jgi:hypothetical protein
MVSLVLVVVVVGYCFCLGFLSSIGPKILGSLCVRVIVDVLRKCSGRAIFWPYSRFLE